VKRLSAFLFASAVALLLGSSEAQASILWSYDWSGSSSTTAVMSDTGNTQVNFVNQPLLSASGSSNVIASNLSVQFNNASTTSDTYTNRGYSLAMLLKDTASGAATMLTFSGVLNGNLTPLSTNLNNAFNNPTTQQVTLGAGIYTVTIGPFQSPGPFRSPQPATSLDSSIGAHVDVQPNPEFGGNPNPSPEPSSLLLASLGMSFTGLVYWRKRKG